MKKQLVFATNNLHKLQEVREMFGSDYQVLSLEDISCMEEIPETADTLEGNAFLKASHVKQNYGYDCFADDTGLEVAALDNAPGVYSARYAGESKDSQANIRKLLTELEIHSDRSARFRTAVSLIFEGNEYLFEGIVKGTIISESRGTSGFGYDPVFIPEGCEKTFAEMGSDLKNTISHRAEAIKKLKLFLNEEKLD